MAQLLNCRPGNRSQPGRYGLNAAFPSTEKHMHNQPAATPPQLRAGLRSVEFTHMVMCPACGLVRADMGAEVIKVEPIAGDRTRQLLGAGIGFFPDVQPQQEKHRA